MNSNNSKYVLPKAGTVPIFPSAAGGGGGAETGASGPDITTFINITYADYERIKNIDALGNINIVQQPGTPDNRFTLTDSKTNNKFVEGKEVLVVIEHNNTIYSVNGSNYIKRGTNILASNHRTDVIDTIYDTKLGSADSTVIQSRPSTPNDQFALESVSETPQVTPRSHTTDDPTTLPHKIKMTHNSELIDMSVYPFFTHYESAHDKEAFLKSITEPTTQNKILKATHLDHQTILKQHFPHNNNLSQTSKSTSNLHNFPRARDMNNKELRIGDTVKVIKSQTTGIKRGDLAIIQDILHDNNVVIKKMDANSSRTVLGDHLLFITHVTAVRGGGKETRRKRTTKSNNNKTRSNRNKNI